MRYLVSEGSVGPAGRRVRCASCGHQWFQEGEEGLDATLFEDDDVSFAESSVVHEKEEQDFEEILRKEIESAPIPEGVRPVHNDADIAIAVAQPSAKKKLPMPSERVSGFAAAAAVWILIIAALLALQPQISRAWPPSNMLYNLVGLTPVLPGEGLALESLEAEMADGKISMRGTVINLRESDLGVPAIMASIVDKDKKILDRVLIAPPVGTLKAEGQASFDASYPKIPEGATNVTFAFSFLKATPAEPSAKTAAEDEPEHQQPAPHH